MKRDDPELSSEDRRWVELTRELFAPEPMDPLHARAFERRLFARLEPRSRLRWLAAPLVAAALGALALWLSSEPTPPAAQPAAATLHAFADPDAGIALVEPDDYLPDDYLALASFVEPDSQER